MQREWQQLYLNFDIPLATGTSPLESHVFQKVCNAIIFVIFVDAPSVDKDADSGCFSISFFGYNL
tara:strand:+ start:2230 stop:2424 length:195 start_codon:yes stop_codon:yes gene_type:complete